jgi:ribosomal protein S18 acetylase RimI-like enzyme
MNVQVVDLDASNGEHTQGLLDVLDSYARDPIGGGQPLTADVRRRLPSELLAQEGAIVLLALVDERPVGAAVCFRGYSTFASAPILNIHDLAVLPEFRGRGAGQALLDNVEARAKALGCCKITLEVREDNHGARALYQREGFDDYTQGGQKIRTLFLEKKVERAE